jgi:hypothetical protein
MPTGKFFSPIRRAIANRFTDLSYNEERTGRQENFCLYPDGSPKQCNLSVRKTTDGLKFCCFSNSCPVSRGTIRLSALEVVVDRVRKAKQEQKKTFETIQIVNTPRGITANFTDTAMAFMAKYELSKTDLYKHGAWERPEQQRVYFPIKYDLYKETWAARSYNGAIHPKWLYPAGSPLGDIVFTSFGTVGGEVVIVEDILSAIKAAKCKGVEKAIAILGTQVTDRKITAITKVLAKGQSVLVCLDRDAWTKSVQMANTLIKKGYSAKPKLISKDLKSLSLDQIQTELMLRIKG